MIAPAYTEVSCPFSEAEEESSWEVYKGYFPPIPEEDS